MMISKMLTPDKRHSRDCMWFLAKESPTKAMDLPLASSRKRCGSKRGSSQPSGFHLHCRNSLSGLPNLMQFWWSWIMVQVTLV